MQSRFKSMYRGLRAIVLKPNDVLYIVHTDIGAITVRRFHWQDEVRYVFLEGEDEAKNMRFVGFSEEQLSTFAVEVRPKSADKSQPIGFTQGSGESA